MPLFFDASCAFTTYKMDCPGPGKRKLLSMVTLYVYRCRATIWYCRCFSALSVLGLNEVMALRASASVFFSLTAFLARLAASSEKEAQSMKRDWRAALSCMDCLASASSATNRLWSLRFCTWLSMLAWLIQPSAMPPHIVGNVQLTSFFQHFFNCQGVQNGLKWFLSWMAKMYIITHPTAKHWLKHNALKCPEPHWTTQTKTK